MWNNRLRLLFQTRSTPQRREGKAKPKWTVPGVPNDYSNGKKIREGNVQLSQMDSRSFQSLENLKRIRALADDVRKQVTYLWTWSTVFFSGHGGGFQRLQLRRSAASWITAGANRCI